MTVTVKKLGGSVAVVIPKAIASEMLLVEGTSLEVIGTADAIVMRKSRRRPRRSLRSIMKAIDPAAYARRRRTLVGDKPVGKELW
jgi:antitoxin component of MazEF toxin-antitoxin module